MNEEEIAEYNAAHASFHHYDSFRWQPGSMLLGCSLILWGFILSKDVIPSHSTVAVFSTLIALLLASWLYLAHHYRQLFMSKLYRIHEIEYKYDMRLNLAHGFMGKKSDKNNRAYPRLGPKGHNVDIAIFAIISMFGPVVVSFERGFDRLYVLPIMIVMFVSIHIVVNEFRLRKFYSSMSPYA